MLYDISTEEIERELQMPVKYFRHIKTLTRCQYCGAIASSTITDEQTHVWAHANTKNTGTCFGYSIDRTDNGS